MAKGQRTNQQSWDNLVTDPEADRRIKGIMGQGHRGSLGNHIARKQRQLHPWTTLSYTITHGRHATGNLCRGTMIKCGCLDLVRVARVRLMRRQHIVIGRDNTDVGLLRLTEPDLGTRLGGGIGVGLIGTRQLGAARRLSPEVFDARQIGATQIFTALNNTCSDLLNDRMQRR